VTDELGGCCESRRPQERAGVCKRSAGHGKTSEVKVFNFRPFRVLRFWREENDDYNDTSTSNINVRHNTKTVAALYVQLYVVGSVRT
jgi:hypothetical protein